MENDKIKTYSYRISQANKTELVIIMYEILVDYIEEAKKCENIADYQTRIKKAKRVVDQLQYDLNMEYEISAELLRIYLVMQKYLIFAISKRNDEAVLKLDSVVKMAEMLKNAFDKILEKDKSEPIMQNAQRVYAGLTYSKGGYSNEVIAKENSNRGYMV